MIQDVGKNITKPSALKFFGNNFSFGPHVKKKPSDQDGFDEDWYLLFFHLRSRFDIELFITFFVIKGDVGSFLNVVVDHIFGQ